METSFTASVREGNINIHLNEQEKPNISVNHVERSIPTDLPFDSINIQWKRVELSLFTSNGVETMISLGRALLEAAEKEACKT